MATEEEISNWLDKEDTVIENPSVASDDEIASFLDDKTADVEKPVVTEDDSLSKIVSDFGAGATDQFLNLLDIPNSVYNWSAEKLGSDSRFPSTRDLGKELGIGYAEGEEPDTGSYRAGEYTAMGLEFLAPILNIGKIAEGAITTGKVLAGDTVASQTGTLMGVAQQITKPFASAPKLATGVEVTGGAVSGYGSYYGEQEFGEIGGQIGGLAGVAPALVAGSLNRTGNYIVKSFFPFTDKGGRAKAGAVIRQLRESPDFLEEIKRQKQLSLKETSHTPARLSKEPYLIALEKALIRDDPQLVHTLRKIDADNNALAKSALKNLAGQGAVEDSIKSLGSRYAKLKTRLDLKVDSALAKTKTIIDKMAPLNQRKAVNIAVKKQIDVSLKAARESENALWGQVDKKAIAPTEQTKSAYLNIMASREAEADPSDIPSYLKKFLGRFNKKTGELVGGKYEDSRHVGGLQELRSRLLQTIRSEKAGDTPNWNKVRILEDIEEAMLKDMGDSSASTGLNEAIKFSRELNKKFKGDIMSIILRNSKTGGGLAPELTLESLGAGSKGAFQIKRILEASPESKGNIEDILKMDIIQQKVVKGDTLNIVKAKDYMSKNSDIMDMFPVLKDDMDNAISLAEAHKYFEGSAKVRLKKAESALGFSLADKTNPGTFLTKIMSSKNPVKTMERVIRQVNEEGKVGIKNDVVELILKKAKTADLNSDNTPMLSGKKAIGFWNDNKDILSKALNKKERKRLDRILNDLRLGDDPKDIPIDVAKAALIPEKTILGWVVEVAAARWGAMLGKGTSGASLKTASKASNTAKDVMDKLDMGTAKKLLKAAVQDEKLYDELARDMSSLSINEQPFNALSGWILAHMVSSLEEKTDIED